MRLVAAHEIVLLRSHARRIFSLSAVQSLVTILSSLRVLKAKESSVMEDVVGV